MTAIQAPEQINAKEPQAFNDLVEALYGELRRTAASLMRNERQGHTLEPTALVNEAILSLCDGDSQWDSRGHFFGSAAQAMRRVLVSHARKRGAEKRGGSGKRITFQELAFPVHMPSTDVLAVDEALDALAAHDRGLAEIMELRYFAGCSLEEVAAITKRSLASVKRDWTYARAWLYNFLNG